jgi:hypothetical protein
MQRVSSRTRPRLASVDSAALTLCLLPPAKLAEHAIHQPRIASQQTEERHSRDDEELAGLQRLHRRRTRPTVKQ